MKEITRFPARCLSGRTNISLKTLIGKCRTAGAEKLAQE
jgi:hypothetical protein